MKRQSSLTLLAVFSLSASVAQATVADFENLALAPESYFSSNTATTFNSGDGTFSYNCNIFGGVCYWNGFTYSNTTDTTTAGFGNQYSAITGSGVNGSSNYGVANPGFTPSRVDFAGATLVDGAYFTNTTYAYLSMLNGDQFAKKFEAGDFFTLTVSGLDNTDTVTASLDISLADGVNLLDSWLWTDLSSLGSVYALEFTLSSSDVGAYGMNTPAYFAMDDLTTSAVPVPAAAWLFGSGLLGLIGVSRRR
ncbi:MAG TPA: DUF4465 domain-containing protein [Thiotrichales bacterium]|nr:DUF4465 domain-containing protein [Thiotrichales bacterium]